MIGSFGWFAFDIVGFPLGVYMLLFAHYPFNLDVALGGLRTRGSAPEPGGPRVQIAGGCWVVASILGTLSAIGFLGEIWEIIAIIIGILGVALVIASFLQLFSRKPL